jgi:hypothetical protein
MLEHAGLRIGVEELWYALGGVAARRSVISVARPRSATYQRMPLTMNTLFKKDGCYVRAKRRKHC